MRVFFDTNVVNAAFAADGSSQALLRHVLHGAIDAVVSEQVLTEIDRNLGKLKRIRPESRRLVVEVVREISEVVQTPRRSRKLSRDRDDDAIVQAAISCRADVLVTGDDDLLSIPRRKSRIEIVTPRELLGRIEAPDR